MSKASIVRGRAKVAAEPAEAPAPAGRGKSKVAKAAEPAEATAPARGRGKAAAAAPTEPKERAPRGEDRPYKLLVKENPFREGSKRHGFWEIMKRCKTTGAVRAEEPLCTTAFFNSIAEREPAVIEYLD